MIKISKITFKGNQAWVVFQSEEGKYLGTWHCVDEETVKYLREKDPDGIEFMFTVGEALYG